MRGTAQPSTSRTVPVTEELNAHGLLALPWATALYLEPAWQEGGELAVPSMCGVSIPVGALPRPWVQHPHPLSPHSSY